MSQVNKYSNLSASGSVLAGAGTLSGMICNSVTTGAIDFIDNVVGTAGTYIMKGFVPTVGYHNLGNVNCILGCYASMHGTMNYTVHTKLRD
jgi:hypothetical protein